jgi:hypothetical protein
MMLPPLWVLSFISKSRFSITKEGPRGRFFAESKPYKADTLIFATGGMSTPNLGSDGSLFTTFFRHGYNVIPLKPSLCPIATKEKTKSLLGLRHEAKVTVTAEWAARPRRRRGSSFQRRWAFRHRHFQLRILYLPIGGHPRSEPLARSLPGDSSRRSHQSLVEASTLNPKFFLDAYLQAPLRDYVLKAAGVSLANL